MSSPSETKLDVLELSTFLPLIGAEFSLSVEPEGEVQAKLTLASARSLGATNPLGRESFSLVFEGDPGVAIPQGIFWLENPGLGRQGIFMVPISSDSKSRRYEAVFN